MRTSTAALAALGPGFSNPGISYSCFANADLLCLLAIPNLYEDLMALPEAVFEVRAALCRPIRATHCSEACPGCTWGCMQRAVRCDARPTPWWFVALPLA